MKRIAMLVAVLFMSTSAWAQGEINEYGEEVFVEQVPQHKTAPKKSSTRSPVIVEKNVGSTSKKAPKETASPAPTPKHYGSTFDGRAHRFQVGLVGPGIGVVSEGIGALMTLGAEGDYFFFERLSAGLRIEMATKFTRTTLVSFVPHVRYTYDLARHPRWSLYGQGGVGVVVVASGGSTNAAADIAIPSVGASWRYRENWSFGADSSLHVYARGGYTAVGFVFAPTVRYLF